MRLGIPEASRLFLPEGPMSLPARLGAFDGCFPDRFTHGMPGIWAKRRL
jgi:hypothetical protein